ncbi:vanadium-dependent haloperoxidase [Agromyces italicus]|uniref:vanadium-dependent haloperoxidase n=1 Tax=Agromyces italicus TaxID=279572 RepID=UPI0003B3CEBA|nr:vanadium-dependent haloperoxidase [Agromyces italicus]
MSRLPARTLAAIVAVAACVLSPVLLAAPAHADPDVGRDAEVIRTWSRIAEQTIAPPPPAAAVPVPASPLYFSFVSIAMYDAVVAIEGGYRTFLPQPRAHAHASPEVAAATAAHAVLRHDFPEAAGALDAALAAELADVPRGVGLVHGTRVGTAAAASIIAAREGDGRGDPHPLETVPAAGVWRPTPPGNGAMAVPWLGFVDPLVLESATQFPLPGPPALDSAEYAAEFDEVKAWGAEVSAVRSQAQTDVALFWNANPLTQFQGAMRVETAERGFDISETARAFALLGTSEADALISCWREKYDHPFWRPITAITLADTDGNGATTVDAAWKPLRATPAYPEYASGHACATGSSSEVFGHLFGPDSIDLDVSAGAITRSFDSVAELDDETMNARIWLGYHFRSAMEDGSELGHRVAQEVIDKAFTPIG